MRQRNNTLIIVLSACGGCVLLAVIVFAVLGYFAAKSGGGKFMSGAMKAGMNMPRFMTDLKTRNYTGAAALVDPSVQDTLSAEKLQKMEEGVEKKLGPMQSIPTMYDTFSTNVQQGGPNQMTVEYDYTYTLTYTKGKAAAHIKIRVSNAGTDSGNITGFTLEPIGAQ